MQKRLLFLTLKVFSVTGGIEKVCRVAGKALHEISQENGYTLDIWSMYDDGTSNVDAKYFPTALFKGYSGKRVSFVLDCIRIGRKTDVVILSHINLLTIAFAIKKVSPKTKVVLIAHGIEVWKPLPEWKKRLLRSVDLILPISRFTKEKMKSLHGLEDSQLQVVNNCLDPFLPPAKGEKKNRALLGKYGLTNVNQILLTVCRLSGTERNKGYDEVIRALNGLRMKYPEIKYLLVGKWDKVEKERLDRLVEEQGVKDSVIFTGFVPDTELADHFRLADVFIMPSRKEGFGLVFIESMYYGLPVIAGNVDGSVDALAGGELGMLVNPFSYDEVVRSIRAILDDSPRFQPNSVEVLKRFGFDIYKENLKEVLGYLLPKLNYQTLSKEVCY